MNQLHIHTINYYLAQAAPGLVSFIGLPIYVSVAGKDAFGVFALVMSMVLVVQAFSSTWLNQAILRYRSELAKNDCRSCFSSVVSVGVVASIIVSGIVLGITLLIVAPFIKGEAWWLALFVSGSAILYGVLGVVASSRLDSRRVVVAEAFRAGATLLVSLALLAVTDLSGEVSLLVGVFCGLAIGVFVLGRLVGVKAGIAGSGGRFVWGRCSLVLSRFVRYGGPLSIWMALVQMHNVSDRLQISYFVGIEETAEYSVVYDITYKLFGFALVPILSAAHPIIMNQWNADDSRGALATIFQALKVQLVVSVLVLLILAVFQESLVRYLLRGEGEGAATIVFPVAAGFMFWQVSMILQKVLEATDRVHIMIVLIVISLAINVVGNFLFIPIFGYAAAAYTTLASSIAYASGVVVFLMLSSKRLA